MASFVSRRFLSTTARRLANQTEEKAAAEASNGPALVRTRARNLDTRAAGIGGWELCQWG